MKTILLLALAASLSACVTRPYPETTVPGGKTPTAPQHQQ